MKSLLTVIVLTGTIFFAELIAGLLSGSLALLSDAMHMLSDSTGLIIALLAMLIGRREATSHATFGFRRVEVLAAAINAATVSIISVWIVIEALSRLGGTEEIDTFMMITVAIIGFIANGISALILVKRQNDSLNMRGAYLHVLSDMLGSVAVIIAGFIIYFTGWIAADTIASLVIAALVLPRSLKLLFTSVGVLLERAPGSVDTKAIEKALAELPEVHAVHDLHIWTTDGATLLATAHLVVDANRVGDCTILDRAQAKLEKWNITHSTIQLERPGHDAHEQVC
ncbi:cation diffusion facilitator family transporter [Corynebacterium caspium]|uniref:cation diffusion facilitator family transporter n=1 Tax=Corynebacterium caspium TaxID=234828 RepID=UPI0006882979